MVNHVGFVWNGYRKICKKVKVMDKKTTNVVGALLGIALTIGVVYGLSWAISKGWSKGKEE
jgi:hypothetical protein